MNIISLGTIYYLSLLTVDILACSGRMKALIGVLESSRPALSMSQAIRP
jgi:hypothetical protein